MGMILGYVFPPMANSSDSDIYDEVRQVAVLWTDKEAETSFQWGVIQYLPVDNDITDEQIVNQSVVSMPDNIRNFINLYNDPETREEAKVLYALGYVQGMSLGDCDND